MNIYFVYIYKHPITKIPFYVGYGKNNRHLYHLNEAIKYPIPQHKEHKLNTIRKILQEGMKPIIEIIDLKLSKEEACELEMFLISEIGRKDKNEGPLTNLTMGGDGNRGWSSESRKQMSDKFKNMISVKNPITGIKFKIHKDDPRWISGELVGQNYQKTNLNKNGKLNNYILAKDQTGNIFRIKSNDPRWISGELVGINKNKPCPESTKLASSKTHKGVPKSLKSKEKISKAIKELKWFCNFELNKVGRFKDGLEPEGYIRVSGPHKRKIII